MDAEYKEGGLKMVNMLDFQKCLNLQWAGKRITASTQNNWSIIPKWHLSRIAKGMVFFI